MKQKTNQENNKLQISEMEKTNCIQWNLSIRDALGAWLCVLITEVPGFRSFNTTVGHRMVSLLQWFRYLKGL